MIGEQKGIFSLVFCEVFKSELLWNLVVSLIGFCTSISIYLNCIFDLFLAASSLFKQKPIEVQLQTCYSLIPGTCFYFVPSVSITRWRLCTGLFILILFSRPLIDLGDT